MDPEALIDGDNPPTSAHDAPVPQDQSIAPPTATSFNWQAADTALLQPNQLGISKVQRGWERKPKIPFARPGARVGKVWKRPQITSHTSSASEAADPRSVKRRKARRSSLGGEKKPLKKMCLDSSFGMAPRVLAWDGGESPARKIVTRTSATNEDLLALSDEDEGDDVDEEQGDVTIEILDEDGTVLDVNPEDGAEEAEWEDEDVEHSAPEDEFNDTMMHLAEIIDASQQPMPLEIPQVDAGELPPIDDFNDMPEIEQENQDPALLQLPQMPPPHPQQQPPVIPEGFVSPMKPPVPVVKNRRRSLGGPRRRTLPRQFAPSPLSQVMNVEESFHESTEQTEAASPTASKTSAAAHPGAEINTEGQWEDVEGSSPSPETAQLHHANQNPSTTERSPDVTMSGSAGEQMNEEDNTQSTSGADDDTDDESQRNSPQHLGDLGTPSKLPSSPIPTIEGQHPRLPLRRSPRRKSSSPMKKSIILPSNERPHLIAFTPIKGSVQFPFQTVESDADMDVEDAADVDGEPSSPLERSASAPPEESQVSPRKPAKPRVSDDTALLQAFLNRAAESKGSRRISAAKRESITNRRDSDAVKQALGQAVASPAKAEVLGELDVNSPSPRKPAAPAMDTSTVFDQVINEAAAKAAQEEADEDTSVGQRTRRSGRGSKRAQPSTPAAPNKISIRGNTEGVVLKRTEAQEMALVTRNNTRKNKGGAVLPPLRLTKMASQFSNAEPDATTDRSDAAANKKTRGRKGVQWSETLVEFFQGGDMSESSVLSDELNAPAPQEQPASKMEIDAPVAASAPPPSETPSKPKIRRLKAPRTASTPGKAPAAPEAPPTEQEKPAPESRPQAPTKRRSRIATPAKGLTNPSLLPSDPDTQPSVPTEATKSAPAKKRAAPVSKLPGPASTTSTSTSFLGQGKENLIASPPKKKPASTLPPNTRTGVPGAKFFAPRLDFGKSTRLEPSSEDQGEVGLVPGLMSPAKKGGRGRNVFGGEEGDGGGKVGGRELGLASPAKKRTRRAGGR